MNRPVNDEAPVDTKPPSPRARLHPDVLKLGWVSFLTDLSSEMIFSVFAIFFTSVAGASSALLGLVEGLADFSASSLNYLAGWLSDRSGRRKWLVTAGYGFSTVAKLILLVSSSVLDLGIFRVIERLGKGFRGPPRDAWLSTVAEKSSRGYAFGVHKALDKSGAVLGPLVAYALLSWLGESDRTYSLLFWVACVPAVISIVVLARMPDQPGRSHERESMAQNWLQLSPGFKRFLLPAGVFALAYFSLGFFLLKAHALGFGVTDIVLLYALFNTTCVVAAPLVGRLGDRVGRSRIVVLGYAVYPVLNLGLLWVSRRWEMVAVFAIYGFFMRLKSRKAKPLLRTLSPSAGPPPWAFTTWSPAFCTCLHRCWRGLCGSWRRRGSLPWAPRCHWLRSAYLCCGPRALNGYSLFRPLAPVQYA